MTKCPIATAVAADIEQRAAVGLRKYGVTLARTDVDLKGKLQHAFEEACDLAVYLKWAMAELDGAQQPQPPPPTPIPPGQRWLPWSFDGWKGKDMIDMLFTDNSIKSGMKPIDAMAFRNAKAWRVTLGMVGG